MVNSCSRGCSPAKRSPGFTLVEVVVVVLILAVLSSIALVAIGGVTRSARVRACQTDWRTLSVALNSYRTDTNGTDPTGFADLIGGYLDSNTVATDAGTGAKYIKGDKYQLTLGTSSGATIISVTGNQTFTPAYTVDDCSAAIR